MNITVYELIEKLKFSSSEENFIKSSIKEDFDLYPQIHINATGVDILVVNFSGRFDFPMHPIVASGLSKKDDGEKRNILYSILNIHQLFEESEKWKEWFYSADGYLKQLGYN